MTEYFEGGGVAMWPLLLVLLAVLFLAARAATLLARGEVAEVEGTLRSILFWGGMSLVMGVLGTAVGLVQMGAAIARVGRVAATTVFGGVGVALITTVFGLLIFLVAAVLWFALRQWHLRRAAPAAGAAA